MKGFRVVGKDSWKKREVGKYNWRFKLTDEVEKFQLIWDPNFSFGKTVQVNTD